MSWLWEQSAWIRLNNKSLFYSSETQTLLSGSSTIYNSLKQGEEDKCGKPDKEWFYQWLVGFTDGDGCFNIYSNNNKITLTFKISQKINNIQVLYYIKKQLGVGSVKSEQGMAHFLIRDKKSLETVLIPIFDKYLLLTSKEFSYKKFRLCLEIGNSTLSQMATTTINSEIIPQDYIPSSWNIIPNPITKPWLVGFIEAEGSFYITRKSEVRLVHGFGLTQKLDKVVVLGIKQVLKIESNVKWNKKGFFSLDTTNSNSLKWIKNYFYNTMKSRKSLEFRIWARSFRDKGKYDKLLRIKLIIDKISG